MRSSFVASAATVSNTHIDGLLASAAVVIKDALQFTFSPQDEELAVSSIAARLLDWKYVCFVRGPSWRPPDAGCLSPPFPNGMVGITWNSPASCKHCSSKVEATYVPEAAKAALGAEAAASEGLLPGDVVAILGGPAIPASSPNVWWYAPVYDDSSAVFVDDLFETRETSTRADRINAAADAPFLRDTSTCRTGPLCEAAHGYGSRCLCD